MIKKQNMFRGRNDFIFSHAISEDMREAFPPHSHDIYELLYIKEGNLTYMVDGKIYTPPKNSLIITKPFELHSIKMNEACEYDRYNVLFDERYLSFEAAGKAIDGIDVIEFGIDTNVRSCFEKFEYYSEHFGNNMKQMILINIIEEIFFNVMIFTKKPSAAAPILNPIVSRTIEYINENITKTIKLDMICNEFFISKSYLYQLFVKHLKISPQKYIITKKLTMSQRDIRLGAKPTDVYTRYGFIDYSNFYKNYKRYFGHSPSDEPDIDIQESIIL